jgi:hypothetical protein
VVLDNLREGVLSADINDPTLNPLCCYVLAHYGVMALPCKVRDPDRKGMVESGVNHAQMTQLKGKKFESLEAAQAYLDHWEQRWADTRIHGRTKRQVAAMFSEEKPHLRPLPLGPFRYYQYGSARFIWMAASRLKRLITVRLRDGSVARSMCSGTCCMCGS